MRNIKVKTVTVGVNFSTSAMLYVNRKKVEGEIKPFGCKSAAIQNVIMLASKQGFITDDERLMLEKRYNV
jgi:hypothetical protein